MVSIRITIYFRYTVIEIYLIEREVSNYELQNHSLFIRISL